MFNRMYYCLMLLLYFKENIQVKNHIAKCGQLWRITIYWTSYEEPARDQVVSSHLSDFAQLMPMHILIIQPNDLQ